jgi:hypothetical protein
MEKAEAELQTEVNESSKPEVKTVDFYRAINVKGHC